MPERPTGNVTFFFTDIEGSTKLWEEHPEGMKQALARHDAILRTEIESRGGYVFKTVGDAFCAAFSSPLDALNAAIASQLALQSEKWGGLRPLRIRVALHAGRAEERDGDYFGPEVNRVARLLSLVRGGHTIVSGETRDQVAGLLSDPVSLRDLGEHFLRDVKGSVRVFHLMHPALPSDYPLSKVSDPSLHNLPMLLSAFVGREKEIAEIKQWLSSSRLITLVGGGGSGKTRLSIEAAGQLVSAYQDGVRFVDLAPLSDPEFVPQELARVFGLMEDSGVTLLSSLADYLKKKHVLVILDNCEHLLDACARLSESLLRSCPQLRILATSRQSLGISGEVVYRVPSLSSPDPHRLFDYDQISQCESVRLFVDRARVNQPRFVLTPQNAAAIAQICVQVDGIPLAIELAAARVRVLPPEQIAKRLQESFRFLAGGSRTAHARHQTLLATMEWSHSHLLAREQVLFRRLEVFSGGFSLEACEEIGAGGDIDRSEVLDLLSQLVDKSLVMCEEDGRYRLLVPVREYAAEKLKASGEENAVRNRHRDYFARLAEKAEPALTGSQAGIWVKRLEAEHDNLRAALAWSEKNPEGAGVSLQLAGALWKFWYRGYLTEARRWLEGAIARDNEAVPAPVRGRAYLGAGTIAWRQSDYPHVIMYCTKSLELFKASGIKMGIAYSLNSLASVSNFCGDYAEAKKGFQESYALFEEAGDLFGMALTSIEMGMTAHWEGEYERALDRIEAGIRTARGLDHYWCVAFGLTSLGWLQRSLGKGEEARMSLQESIEKQKTMQDRSGLAESLCVLGLTQLDSGQPDRAEATLQEALELADKVGSPWMTATVLDGLGRVAFTCGKLSDALDLYRQSLLLRRQVGDKRGMAESLEGCACVLHALGDSGGAVRALATACACRARLHAPVPPADADRVERVRAGLHEKFGMEAFEVAWQEGSALGLEAASGEVLQEHAPHA